jgi:Leucine rich repeat
MKYFGVFAMAVGFFGNFCSADVNNSGSYGPSLSNGQVEDTSEYKVDRRSWKASLSREEYREHKRLAKRNLLEEQRRLKETRAKRHIQQRLEIRDLKKLDQRRDQAHNYRRRPYFRRTDRRRLQLSNHMQLAENWLNSHPNFVNISNTEKEQMRAMAAFYYAAGGANWFGRDNWLSYVTDVCEWFNQALQDACNPNKFLVELELNENNLGGFLMTEISELYNLHKLDLEGNSMRGTIPTEIARLFLLEDLNLDTNQMSGGIPTVLGLMTSLEELTLKENKFTGPIPTELGMLLYLEELDLSENQLTGTLPATLGSLTSLEVLDVYFNFEMNGTIPASIWTLPELKELVLEFNFFRDTIPTTVGRATSLEVINLQDNYFFGPIPTGLGNLTSLEKLYLEGNDLTGTCTKVCGADITPLSSPQHIVDSPHHSQEQFQQSSLC